MPTWAEVVAKAEAGENVQVEDLELYDEWHRALRYGSVDSTTMRVLWLHGGFYNYFHVSTYEFMVEQSIASWNELAQAASRLGGSFELSLIENHLVDITDRSIVCDIASLHPEYPELIDRALELGANPDSILRIRSFTAQGVPEYIEAHLTEFEDIDLLLRASADSEYGPGIKRALEFYDRIDKYTLMSYWKGMESDLVRGNYMGVHHPPAAFMVLVYLHRVVWVARLPVDLKTLREALEWAPDSISPIIRTRIREQLFGEAVTQSTQIPSHLITRYL